MTQTRTRRFGLSKSKITAFEQCPKKLWLATHRPGLAEQDAGAEARFAIGNDVGRSPARSIPAASWSMRRTSRQRWPRPPR